MNLAADHPAYPSRPYRGLIFDCDGTLTDSMPLHYVAWRQTMERYGILFSEERFYAMGGMPSDKIIGRLAAEHAMQLDDTAVAQEKEEAFLELLHLLEPIAPVIHVAATFRGKVPLAVASGGFREIILRQLVQIGCANWFSVLVTAEDTERHKPFPDVFLEAACQLGVPANDCLVYEDSDLGLQAARAAGMDAIDIRRFHTPKKVHHSP